jgi:hypothetical protein
VRLTSYRNLFWIIALLAAFTATALAQAPADAAQAQSAVVRVTSPRPEQRQTDNFVTVHYELQNPTSASAGSPNFQVQLDGNDPVTTTSTEQSFTGLTAGQHVITIRMVDANGTAVPDSQTQVRIFVVPTAQNGGETQVERASIIPDSASLLPVAALLGFSCLVGGIVCGAWKTRP